MKKAYPPLLPGNRRFSVPSWVMPGTLAENCLFLAGKVHEVEVLFFETKACLQYGEDDIPQVLADLPLTYHAHLPADLPGKEGKKDAEVCCALLEKASHLGIKQGVLHLPQQNAARYMMDFCEEWKNQGLQPEDIWVENTKNQSLLSLEDVLLFLGVSVCLDLGHIMAYSQQALLQSPLFAKTALVHLNAVADGRSAHLPLTALDSEGKELGKSIVKKMPDTALCMLELFTWNSIVSSLPLVCEWLE